LESVERQTGVRPEELDSVDVPDEAEYIWAWYWEMNRAESLSFAEIEAWTRLTGIALSPWEVRTIKSMDKAVQAEIGEITRQKHGRS